MIQMLVRIFGAASLPALALVILFTQLLCASQGQAGQKKLTDIEQAKELVLGVCDEDFPPFSFRSHGSWVGYDIELA
ncbi:hypothetical protein LJC46_03540, partial [Desulfovibrio sp. OttesenSCG-928-G15]|nr:hypothetical protein [Desulfovibrio sp. OttesenSCG-928-G15]